MGFLFDFFPTRRLDSLSNLLIVEHIWSERDGLKGFFLPVSLSIKVGLSVSGQSRLLIMPENSEQTDIKSHKRREST